MSGSKVLITGSAGFIGAHLAARHVLSGDDVTLVDRNAPGADDVEWHRLLGCAKVTFIQLDLTISESWTRLPDDYVYVYHLCAINGTSLFYQIPSDVLRVNILSAIYCLDWFRRNTVNGKVLFTSSNETYAGSLEAFGVLPSPTPDDVPLVISDVHNPRWAYAGSKIVGEQLFIHSAIQHDFRAVIVRPHNFYGPRAGSRHVVPQLIGRILDRLDPFPIYGAHESRSFCYIDDGVAAIHDVMVSPDTDGGTYNIGAAQSTVIKNLAEQLFAISDWRPARIRAEPAPQGSVKWRLPDVELIRKTVGWEAKVTLADGLRRTYEWYRSRHD